VPVIHRRSSGPTAPNRTSASRPALPLGVGGMPFESTTLILEPDSLVALYTKV
jgi:hypothetical protein